MDKKRFGQFIKESRIAKNLTQAELAEKLYIDVTAVSKWERGVNFPDISMISDICRQLDITEHELIESSRDTGYRQMMYNSRQYLKNRKVAFWTVTSCFLLAILTCFIVNLAVGHTLSWFFIVLSGCACGYWGIMYPVLLKKFRKAVSDDCAAAVLRVSLLLYFAGILIFTLAILFTTHLYSKFDIDMGVKITLYCFIIFFAYGVVEIFRLPRLTKLGIDSILTGIFSVSLAKVLPALMHMEAENYFDIDFTDWAGHTNGNVACITLAAFTVIGIVFIIAGQKNAKKE